MLRLEAEIGQSAVCKEFCCERAGRSKAVAGQPVGQEGLFRWKRLERLYAVWDEAEGRRVSGAGVGSVRRGKRRGPHTAGGRLGRGAETATHRDERTARPGPGAGRASSSFSDENPDGQPSGDRERQEGQAQTERRGGERWHESLGASRVRGARAGRGYESDRGTDTEAPGPERGVAGGRAARGESRRRRRGAHVPST